MRDADVDAFNSIEETLHAVRSAQWGKRECAASLP